MLKAKKLAKDGNKGDLEDQDDEDEWLDGELRAVCPYHPLPLCS